MGSLDPFVTRLQDTFSLRSHIAPGPVSFGTPSQRHLLPQTTTWILSYPIGGLEGEPGILLCGTVEHEESNLVLGIRDGSPACAV